MTANSQIAEMFDHVARGASVARNNRVMVASLRAKDLPGEAYRYRIVGLTHAYVQAEIDRLMGQVEAADGDGLCSFSAPSRLRSGPDAGLYAAEGTTQIFAPAVEEVA